MKVSLILPTIECWICTCQVGEILFFSFLERLERSSADPAVQMKSSSTSPFLQRKRYSRSTSVIGGTVSTLKITLWGNWVCKYETDTMISIALTRLGRPEQWTFGWLPLLCLSRIQGLDECIHSIDSRHPRWMLSIRLQQRPLMDSRSSYGHIMSGVSVCRLSYNINRNDSYMLEMVVVTCTKRKSHATWPMRILHKNFILKCQRRLNSYSLQSDFFFASFDIQSGPSSIVCQWPSAIQKEREKKRSSVVLLNSHHARFWDSLASVSLLLLRLWQANHPVLFFGSSVWVFVSGCQRHLGSACKIHHGISLAFGTF